MKYFNEILQKKKKKNNAMMSKMNIDKYITYNYKHKYNWEIF